MPEIAEDSGYVRSILTRIPLDNDPEDN